MKDFFKSVSIYGVLPVIGKFSGFLLIPIYVRVFSSYQFGIVELLVTIAGFLIFAINLEFYSAIGRFFYEQDDILKKKKLVSTGLWMTAITSIIIIFLALTIERHIINTFFDGKDFYHEYRISLLWIPFAAISTYLSVIPRYDKKPKLYVIISLLHLTIRICSTLLYVLVFKLGISGVLYGHITGSIFATILYAFASKKYLGFYLLKPHVITIVKYALPIIPGLLFVGAFIPVTRVLIARLFSIETLGIFAFSVKIVSVMEMLRASIKLAWKPMLFEKFSEPSFKDDIEKISKYIGPLLLLAGAGLTLFSPEAILIIGTQQYSSSKLLIGFLVVKNIFEILRSFRGFGPDITKKTYLLTAIEIIGSLFSIVLMIIISDNLGLIGLGLSLAVPAFICYYIQVSNTKKTTSINFHSNKELLLWGGLIISVLLILIHTSFWLRLISFIALALVTIPRKFIKIQLLD